MKVVELGGGEHPKYRPNLDIRPGPAVDIVADFEKPLPLPDHEYDLVYSSYVIEHVSWRKVKQFIREIFRILKHGGKAEVITANLFEQCKVVANSKDWDQNFSCMIFGDLDYPENSHKCGFSPEYVIKLFKEAGFSRVDVLPHPKCKTDMIINGFKEEHKKGPKKLSSEEYDREYFEDGTTGYHLYRDFWVHWNTLDFILQRNPESVLDVGGARGYIVKKLENEGIRAVCMDISKHCWHTRAIDSFVLHDVTKAPWPFKDKEFDLCVSVSFMEHIAEEDLETVIKEMARVCKRSLHKITFEKTSIDIDVTHKTFRPWDWWIDKFKATVPDFAVEIDNPPKLPVKDGVQVTKYKVMLPKADGLVKLNIGSFMDMYYYGWVNIDIENLHQWAKDNLFIFKQVDVLKGLPYPDSSVDIILASHFIEHLDREEGKAFLRECLRVLKPKGLLRLAVPDAKLLCQKFLNGEIMDYRHVNVGVEKAESASEAFYHLLLAGHKTIYDYDSLKRLVEKAGFTDVKKMSAFKSQLEAIEKQTIGMYPTLSLYLEAKPKKELVKIPSGTKSLRKKSLKIALVSAPFLKVPPDKYGGAEMIIADLAEVLAQMGHKVTIFAADGSKVKGCEIVEFGSAIKKVHVDWLGAEKQAYLKIEDSLDGFDIIHDHTWFGWVYRSKALNPSLKVCHTHHGGLYQQWWGRSKPPFKLNMIAISQWMKSVYEKQGFISKYVYNGMNLKKYPFKRKKGKRLLYVGRFSTFKQPHVAIEIAKKLNIPIDLVGGSFVDDPNYLERIKGMCNGDEIKMYLDASHENKIKLMRNAKCLLFPSRMGEPFGLVAAETMACGTPVVALNDGAIAEVVKEGGFVCNDVDAMVDMVKQVHKIKPQACRKNAKQFDRRIMAKNYLKLYKSILEGQEW